MPVFETVEDLEESILGAGLGFMLGDVVATARPVLLLVRAQVPDDPLPPGTSKMGGYPDLPPGFAWPSRPSGPDAERRAAGERETGRYLRESRERRGRSDAELNAVTDQYEQRAEAHGRTFPLAFQAQLNLSELSREEGFDPDLPRTGLLSIFTDITGYGGPGPCAFWHPPGPLVRTPWPLPLTDWHDLENPSHAGQPDQSWGTLTLADAYTSYSAVCIPDHWDTASRTRRPDRRVSAWHETMTEYRPPVLVGVPDGNFGDRLGGWPLNIQRNVEDEASEDGDQVGEPGETPWRHIFGWGGEFYDGTRLIPWEALADGNACVLLRREDLAARRFDQTVTVIQST